jgi:hypothetical protein
MVQYLRGATPAAKLQHSKLDCAPSMKSCIGGLKYNAARLAYSFVPVSS